MFKVKINSAHQDKKITKNHKKQLGIMNDPRNPYSIYWTNKLLEQKYNMEIGVKGFLNGVPVIDLKKKKKEKKERKKFDDDYIKNNKNKNQSKKNKKRENEDLEEYNTEKINNENLNENEFKNEEEENEDNDNFNEDMDKMFNTNQKNFFKFRKDIKEGIFYLHNF